MYGSVKTGGYIGLLFILGHVGVVQLLLSHGALLHRDHQGRTPLHLAVISGHKETSEMLLTVHSHLLDQQDKFGVGILE